MSETKISQKLYRKACDLLSRREHSQAELRNKLAERIPEAIPDEIEDMLVQLEALGLQSDKRFTESYVRDRRRRGYGPRRISQELGTKGIPPQMFAPFVEARSSEYGEEAQRLVNRKYPVPIDDFDQRMKQKKRATDFLIRRGFDFNTVKAVTEGY